jgi:hypothetical protein
MSTETTDEWAERVSKETVRRWSTQTMGCCSDDEKKYTHCSRCFVHIGWDENVLVCPRCGEEL